MRSRFTDYKITFKTVQVDIHVARDSREEWGTVRVSFTSYSRQFGGLDSAQYEEAVAVVTCFLRPVSMDGCTYQGEMNDRKREMIVTD